LTAATAAPIVAYGAAAEPSGVVLVLDVLPRPTNSSIPPTGNAASTASSPAAAIVAIHGFSVS
jgi:hypothetical protein